MTTRQIPSEEQGIGWMDSLSNWGRWGADDQLGTLNLITDAKRAQAAGLVKEGISITCSRLIVPEMAADVTSIPPLHYMVRAGDSVPAEGSGGTSDFIGFSFHGLTITHLDALCHQVWNGKMYNGQDAAQLSIDHASENRYDQTRGGVISRGVLLDLPRYTRQPWLENGTRIRPADLDACAEAFGFTVEPGDTVWWHPDVIHAVEDVNRGDGYSNVIYIGAAPYCAKNVAYLEGQSQAFLRGASAPDFAAEDYETTYQGRATLDDLTVLGQRQMGLLPW